MQGSSLEAAQRQPLGLRFACCALNARQRSAPCSIALTQDVDQETRTGPVLLQRNSRGGRDGVVRVE